MTPPTKPEPVEIHWHFHVEPGTPILRVGKIPLPAGVAARALLPNKGMVVTLGLELDRDRYVIDLVQVQRLQGQRPITAGKLGGVSLDDLIGVATNLLSYYVADQLGENPGSEWPGEVAKVTGPRTRRTITPELLVEVATAYNETPTVGHVKHTFSTSQRTAQRYIQLARNEGLIK